MKEYLSIVGGTPLFGDVVVGGAKNAALPLLMATLLSRETSVLENIPDLEDISVTVRLLRRFGATVTYSNRRVEVSVPEITETTAPHALVKMMRASFWVLGPILARTGFARVALPGGDAIGARPVDLHLQGLKKLGADVRIEHGCVVALAPGGLSPARVVIDYPSVGATHHLMMTAALIEGETVIEGAAREPEIVEMGSFLSSMGAEVEGAGTSVVTIRGKKNLSGGHIRLCGDRIEATTYLAAGAVTGGKVTVNGITADSLSSVLSLFERMGCAISTGENSVTLESTSRLRAVDFETQPFPGVPTDTQPIFLAALTRADGTSRINETVFENRFGHVIEFRKFGAQIHIAGREATIIGQDQLHGAFGEGGDIRAVAGLIILALMATGQSEIYELHHLDRGYENMVEKLRNLGANVIRVPAFDSKEVVLGC
ncbi:MAG: UDP-N-acetylglucosamine 1-carboxyvinyltransferase [Deltaproteobacteria bacterium]|nr:UDP-N-acetylglucosamine 1-carboxyvinyltransferase [Deltaproteobacteria bacterium]